jgi:hypothetical protein
MQHKMRLAKIIVLHWHYFLRECLPICSRRSKSRRSSGCFGRKKRRPPFITLQFMTLFENTAFAKLNALERLSHPSRAIPRVTKPATRDRQRLSPLRRVLGNVVPNEGRRCVALVMRVKKVKESVANLLG